MTRKERRWNVAAIARKAHREFNRMPKWLRDASYFAGHAEGVSKP